MSDNLMHDALVYSKWGLEVFVAIFVLTFITAFVVPVFILGAPDVPPLFTAANLVLTLPSFLLSLLTWQKVVKPLQDGKQPGKKWREALEILGYFFGLFVGGLMLWLANRKINRSEK